MKTEIPYKSIAFIVENILIWIKIMQIPPNLKLRAFNSQGNSMATNTRRNLALSQQRDRVLRAAAHCFNQKGYSGTSLKDVADLLGLTDAGSLLLRPQ